MRSMCGADAGCSATNYQSLYAGMGTHLGEGQARCSGSEAGSYSRPTDFVYQSTLGLRVIKQKDRLGGRVFKPHRLCVSLNSRLESNKEGEE